jgi:hypothetical protein
LETRDDKYTGLRRKLVSNARAIISDEVGLSMGVRKMCNILKWLKPYGPIHVADIGIFEKYDERTRFIPSGTARLCCSKEAFERYDAALDEVNRRLRKKILYVCFEIIDKFDIKPEAKP